MGLPLFISPPEPETVGKNVEKAAAEPRSSIRRYRPSRARRPLLSQLRRYDDLLQGDDRPESGAPHDADLREINAILDAGAATRRSIGSERGDTRSNTTTTIQPEEEEPLMPPVPESRDYAGGEERGRQERERRRDMAQRILARRVREEAALRERSRNLLRRDQPLGQRQSAPTPPYTNNESSSATWEGHIRRLQDIQNSGGTYPLIPSLASPRPPPRAEPEPESFMASNSSSSDSRTAAGRPRHRMESRYSSLQDRIQSLSQLADNVTRLENLRERTDPSRSSLRSRQDGFDGLGDRDRSLSPEAGSTWETLLTSITPDPQPPSAGSSFASTSASTAAAASSNSGSGRDSVTASMTSVDRQEDPSALIDCEISDSDEDEEDEDNMYYMQSTLMARRTGNPFWRTYADVVTSEREGGPSGSPRDNEYMGGMHRIISRLAERDEIPDEWWASAGLSRNLRQEPTA